LTNGTAGPQEAEHFVPGPRIRRQLHEMLMNTPDLSAETRQGEKSQLGLHFGFFALKQQHIRPYHLFHYYENPKVGLAPLRLQQ
jgi:hypothetical protein